MKKAVVILPTYNEAGTIEPLVKEILKQQEKSKNWEIEIIVNDSYSPDKTGAIVKKLQRAYPAKVHLLETKKEGLGKAYYQAFLFAKEKIKPYVVFEMDADFSHNPADIPKFLKEIEAGADLVIGARYIKGGSIPKNWGWHRKLFSIFGNLTIRFGFMKLAIHDWTSGFRAIKVWVVNDCLDFIKNYSGYVFQIALLDFSLKNNARVAEVPINFVDRKYGKSKIHFSQYIFQILFYLLSHSSFIKFVIVGLVGFAIDFGISYLGIQRWHQAVWLVTLLSTESAIISNFLLNNFWSFSHKKIDGGIGSYVFNFLKFNLVSSGSIAIQTVGMQILVGIFGRNLWYLYKILIIAFVIIPYSYILYNKFIWKSK